MNCVTIAKARAATLALLAGRADGATICPSEVARVLAHEAAMDDWRAVMSVVTRLSTLSEGMASCV